MVNYPIFPGGYLVGFIIFSCFSEFLRLYDLLRLRFSVQKSIYFNTLIQTSVTPLINIKLKTS